MMITFPVISLIGAFSTDAAFGSDIVQMILHAGLMVRFVLFMLFLFSVISWTIIFMKWRLLRKAKQETAYFLDLFWGGEELAQVYQECEYLTFSPVAQLFRAGYSELKRIHKLPGMQAPQDGSPMVQPIIENVERALRRTTIDQSNRMEKAIAFLATTGNTAPFIGLFGTVWGIMESFRGIGLKGSASLAVVAPGISEALVATAAGLVAAIPAVIAFNHFNQKVIVLRSEMDSFISDFISLVERQFIKKPKVAREG
ncbi:protein TolQ [Thermodesulfobacteriota bacterium]